jgi:hypothetical protein
MAPEPRGFAGRAPRAAGILGFTQASSFRPTAGLSGNQPLAVTDLTKKSLALDFRLPAWGTNLRIALFSTRSAGNVSAYCSALLSKARQVCAEHGMQIISLDFTNEALKDTDDPATTDEQIENVLNRAKSAAQNRTKLGDLLVIFCPSTTADTVNPQQEAGRTIRGVGGVPRLPFILINTLTSNPDQLTLIHEMGHAAGLNHEPLFVKRTMGTGALAYLTSRGVRIENNFMSDENRTSRRDMFAFQVGVLGTAFFGSPGNIEG